MILVSLETLSKKPPLQAWNAKWWEHVTIQVNAVAPGFIYTGMTKASFDNPEVRAQSEALIPNGRLGMPEDISSVVIFLLSDMSDYVTGTMLFADGGYHLQK